MRYIGTLAIAALLLAVALKARHADVAPLAIPTDTQTIIDGTPEVSIVAVPGGRDLRVKHLFRGSVSRASLVYEKDGCRHCVQQTTDCQKALSASDGDGFATEVELQGVIPADVNRVEVVVENETGLHVLPVELD